MYFNVHYIKYFLKYCDFHKWQGSFFDEFIYIKHILPVNVVNKQNAIHI